jgi:hypothetical protein
LVLTPNDVGCLRRLLKAEIGPGHDNSAWD